MSVFMPYCRTHSVRGVPPASRGASASPLVASWRRGSGSATGSCPTSTRWRTRHRPAGRRSSARCGGRDRPPRVDTEPVQWRLSGRTRRRRRLSSRRRAAGGSGHRARARADARCSLPPGRWTSLWGDERHRRRQRRRRRRGPPGADPGARPRGVDRPPRRRVGGPVGPVPRSTATPRARRRGPARWRSTTPRGCSPSTAGRTRTASPQGVCIDDAGDGDGPVRHDVVRVEGARAGRDGALDVGASGDFAPPRRVRVVLHGLVASDVPSVDGIDVDMSGNAVGCAPVHRADDAGIARHTAASGIGRLRRKGAAPFSTLRAQRACALWRPSWSNRRRGPAPPDPRRRRRGVDGRDREPRAPARRGCRGRRRRGRRSRPSTSACSGPATVWTSGSGYEYGIFLPDGALVGGCGLHRRIGPSALEIGYWVHVAHTRRGIATASAGRARPRSGSHCGASSAWRSTATRPTSPARRCRPGWGTGSRAGSTTSPKRPARSGPA